MSISESLSGVSTELDKILTQLKDIKSVQDDIGSGAANIGPFGSRPSGGKTSKPVSQSGGSFTTPPKAPGSQLVGITPTATPGGPGGPSGPTVGGVGPVPAPPPVGGGSRLRNAAALGGAALLSAGYNLTPGIQDVVPFQSIKFGASVLSAGGYNQNYYGQVRAMFGGHQSNPYGAMAAANIATMSGQGMGTGNFSTVMRETATTSLIFGMGNMETSSALSNMTSGTMAGRLAQYGIYVSDFSTGNSKGFGNLVDQIWRVHYGSPNKEIPLESVNASIRGGWLGVFLNKVFADDPNLREMVIKALLMKAQAKGQRLDYKSLGRYGQDGATPMQGRSGTISAVDFSVSQGNTPENNPMIVQARAEGSRADVMEATQENTIEGWRSTTYMAVNINEATQAIAENGGPVIDFLFNLKGALQGFSSNGETRTVLNILGGLLGGGGLRSILPFSSGGDVIGKAGTTTSDSIPAMLSRGEYVINARAAQMIGKSRLDAMNSIGHQFGSAFASPARGFAGGGEVGPGDPGYTKPTVLGTVADDRGGTVTAGQATLDKWSALLYGDPALKTYSITGSTLKLSLLERDGIGQYMADFAAAWQAHPALGKGRLNLDKVGTSGAHQPRTTGHGGVSNHAAGVAMDLRWDVLKAHDGDVYDPTDAETSAIRALLKRFNKLEWGGDWVGPGNKGLLDEMHFEIESPQTWGGGGHSPGAAPSSGSTTAPTATPGRENIAAGVRSIISLARGRSKVSGFSSYSGGAKRLGIGRGSFSWISAPLFSSSASGGVTSGSGESSSSTTSSGGNSSGGNSSTGPTPAGGEGPEWLAKFLHSKGLRGQNLQVAWAIAMRESSGVPGTVSSMDGKGMGLFQIQKGVHDDAIARVYGWSMEDIRVDSDKNFQVFMDLSDGILDGNADNPLSDLAAWGHYSASNTSLNSKYYGGWTSDQHYDWITEPFERYYGQFPGVAKEAGLPGYSEGAYNTHEGLAKLHEGEMVLPASTAEQFRKAMRESSVTKAQTPSNIHITLNIEKASDEEAERFARKVKSYLQNDDWFDVMRSR